MTALSTLHNHGIRFKRFRSALTALLLGLMVLVASASLLLTLLLPTILQRFACKPFGIRCSVGGVKIHPHLNLTSDIVIQRLAVYDPKGPDAALRVKRLTIGFDLLELIRTRRFTPSEVRIDAPEALFRRLDDGRWNIIALVQEIRQRLPMAPGATPFQLPRIALTAGAIPVDPYHITGVDLTLEPKPAPLLVDFRLRITVGGRPFEAAGAVSESLEGELQGHTGEVWLDGATHPWTPRATIRFRLDPGARELKISEWLLEDRGILTRGTAALHYTDWPFVYTMTVAAWRADLGALAGKLPFPWLSSLRGQVEGKPVALRGHWPKLPVVSVAATVSGVGLQLPNQRFGATGLKGACRLEAGEGRLRLQAELRGEAVELLGERHSNITLKATAAADPGTGDLALDDLSVSIPGSLVQVRGNARQWGKGGVDLNTTKLLIERATLNRLSNRAKSGITIRSVTRPYIRLRWPGQGHPWQVETTLQSTELTSPGSGHGASLKGAAISVQGVGSILNDLQGAVSIRQVELSGRALTNLQARFEVGQSRVRVPEFHVAVAGGNARGQATISRPSPLDDFRMTLSIHNIRTRELLPAVEKSTNGFDLDLDAEISAAVSHGQASATIDLPPSVTHQLTRLLHRLDQTASSFPEKGHHLVLEARGRLLISGGLQASGTLGLQGLRELLADKYLADRRKPVTLSIGYRNGRFTFKGQEVGFTAHEITPLLRRLGGGRISGSEGTVTLSAEATIGGSPAPSAKGEIVLRGVSLDLIRQDVAPVPLLKQLGGRVVFSLNQGLLQIEETTLRADRGLSLTVKGTLPIGQGSVRGSPFRVILPWTEASLLLSPIDALRSGAIADARFQGQIRADLEVADRELSGVLAVRGVGMESKNFHLDGMTGTIPLAGRIGQVPTPVRASPPRRIDWKDLSEKSYGEALKKWRSSPVSQAHRHHLAIASIRYGLIELRDFEASLGAHEDHVTIERFAFQALGGEAGGWGAVQPMKGDISLALIVDGLSLRAICDAFPPIRGYISGKFNGLADLSVPGLAREKARGKARFWAADSRDERKEISRTLIEKLAGQRIRYFSLFGQDRRYDRGVLEVSLMKRDLVFHELDISHTTIGIKDLDIKVSPDFNKIELGHLIESILKATQRIKGSAETGS